MENWTAVSRDLRGLGIWDKCQRAKEYQYLAHVLSLIIINGISINAS